MLRVPASTLRYWRQTKQGPRYAKIGKKVNYRRQDVEAWWQRQQQLTSH